MRLIHRRSEIELHTLREGEGLPLLLLHELGGSASDWSVDSVENWPGPVHALDFAGHGASGSLKGGGYYTEHFLGDADIALSVICAEGECAVAGAGIGAYVALLLAGARRNHVLAAMLLPGRGLSGGGSIPKVQGRAYTNLDEWDALTAEFAARYLPGTDPMVAACELDTRPEEYVREFVKGARRLILSEAVSVGDDVPPWWHIATEAPSSQLAPAGQEASAGKLETTHFGNALDRMLHAGRKWK